jgi:integrase
MAVRQIAGRWTVEFQQSGTRIFRRLHPGATRGQAQALETKIRADIFAARRLGQQAEPSLAAAIQLWLEATVARKKDQRGPRQNAVLLAPFVTGKTASEATDAAREAIAAWRDLSPSTVNRRLAVLKAALHYCWRQGWIRDNLSGRIERLREPAGRQVYLSRAEVNRLAMAADEPLRTAIRIAAYTGLRASELLIAVPSADRKSVGVPISKSGKPRTVPAPSPIRALVGRLPLAVTYSQLNWAWRAARAAAGLPHARFHDLRHTCASWLINAGVDLFTVGAILGHTAPATTARYAHLAHGTLAKAMRKLK